MIRLEDRLRIALGAGMGCKLDSGDVEIVARMLVVLRKIARSEITIGKVRPAAAGAIQPFEERI